MSQRRRVRVAWLLWLGAGAQVAAGAAGLDGGAGALALVGSTVVLVAFVVANLRLVGMPIVLVGVGLNLLVIALNGGMPVRLDAVLAVGGDPATIEAGSHHLAGPGTRLEILGDVIPIRPLNWIVSFGDLVLTVGILDVGYRLFRPKGGRPERDAREPGTAPATERETGRAVGSAGVPAPA